MPDADYETERQLAEALVDETLASYAHALAADVLADMRAAMIDEMLCTPKGRSLLRQILPERVPDKSGDVERGNPAAAPSTTKKKTGAA